MARRHYYVVNNLGHWAIQIDSARVGQAYSTQRAAIRQAVDWAHSDGGEEAMIPKL